MGKNGFFAVGKIVGVHGIKGTVKVYSYTESFALFKTGALVFVKSSGEPEKSFEIDWARPHKRVVLLSFKEIGNRNDAESLIGSKLFIKRKKLPELDKGSYYWFDITGLSVYDVDGRFIGIVESIIATGSNDVYVVKDSGRGGNNETLIPALESVVLEINLEQKIMRIKLPEGL